MEAGGEQSQLGLAGGAEVAVPLLPLRQLLAKLAAVDHGNEALRAAVQTAYGRIASYERLELVLPSGLAQAVRAVVDVLGVADQVVSAMIEASRSEMEQLSQHMEGIRLEREALEQQMAALKVAAEAEAAKVEEAQAQVTEILQQAAVTMKARGETQLLRSGLSERLVTVEHSVQAASEQLSQLTERGEALEDRLVALTEGGGLMEATQKAEKLPSSPAVRLPRGRPDIHGLGRPRLEVVPELESVELQVTGVVTLPALAAFERALTQLEGVADVQVTGGDGSTFTLNLTVQKGVPIQEALQRLPEFNLSVSQASSGRIVAQLNP
ncbi:MAG: hypothetical protein HYX89_08095 [Chloroflexi bacterium]|nr:hypothetical protein [Chloroflexota bacterium]